MPTRKIKSGPLFRSFTFSRDHLDAEARTVSVAFSSEHPVERGFGVEILDHHPSSVDLSRMTAGAAVLMDHNPSDQVGVVESVEISEDRRGRALIRFGKGERASEIFDDVVDGIRKQISVGYTVNKMQEERGEDSDENVYRVTDWMPFEVSLVSIAADPYQSGVMRSEKLETTIEVEDLKMDEKQERTAPVVEKPSVNVDAEREKAIQTERTRIGSIGAMGDKHGCGELAHKAISEGTSIADFRAQVLDSIANTKQVAPKEPIIGLTDKECGEFSIVRMINAMAHPNDRRAQEAASFEREASDAFSREIGKDPQGMFVPHEVLKREITIGSAPSAGNASKTVGNPIAGDLLASSFIDLLRNNSVILNRATSLTGLVGDIQIPRQASGAQAQWLAAEGANAVNSELTVDMVEMRNRTVAVYSQMSRKLLQQSAIDIEALVRNDLSTAIALELDRVCVNGNGAAGSPTGIKNTAGVSSTASAGTVSWDEVVALETGVASSNALLGGLAYYTNSKVAGQMKTVKKDAGSGIFLYEDANLNGYPVVVSNQMPSDEGAGTNESSMVFGNWRDMLVGMWGGLDILTDPYTNSLNGAIRVVLFQDMDVAVRHPESFSVLSGIVA